MYRSDICLNLSAYRRITTRDARTRRSSAGPSISRRICSSSDLSRSTARWKSKIAPISLPCWPATSSRSSGQVHDRDRDGILQALDLRGDLVGLDQPLGDDQILGVQHDGRADHHAGGDADAFLDLHRGCSGADRQWAVGRDDRSPAHWPLPTAIHHSHVILPRTCSRTARPASGRPRRRRRRRPRSAAGCPRVPPAMIICMTLLPSASVGLLAALADGDRRTRTGSPRPRTASPAARAARACCVTTISREADGM